MKTRFLRMMLATGLVLGLFVAAIGSAGAFHGSSDPYNPGDYYGDCDIDPDELRGEDNTGANAFAFFPWLPNGADDLDGTGPYYGTATVMNMMPWDATVHLFVGVGTSDDNWEFAEAINLEPQESQTLSAATLDVPAGEGASVLAVGFDADEVPEYDHDDEECDFDGELAHIAGVAKNVSPVVGNGASTTSAHTVVDGYSALTGDQVHDTGDGSYILPIVQTWSGWETEIRVANFDDDIANNNSVENVTVTLYPADNQGFGGPSQVVNLDVRPGEVASFNLEDYTGPDWVGSAYIESSALIGAVAERHKADESMLVTNTSRPEHEGDDEHYAALVFKEYNFWNTGISVANLDDDDDNSVTITYLGPTGNQVGQNTLTIPPRGMEFIYTPGTHDLGLNNGFVGAAHISGSHELMASVDQVKYFGNDPDVGQAMSYVTNGDWDEAIPEDQSDGEALVMPLIQKGNPITGNGDTSGVQIFNTDADDKVDAEIVFFGANGNPVAPTVDDNDPQPMEVQIPAHGSYTLYTHNFSEMSDGFRGSVVVYHEDNDGDIVGVSNNVNYEVDGDGSTAFPMIVDSYFGGFEDDGPS